MHTSIMRARIAISAMALAGCSPAPEPYDYETPVRRAIGSTDSVQFSDVTVNAESACGFVSSKNGTEGFTGRVPFIVAGEGSTIDVTLLEDAGPQAAEVVGARCSSPASGIIQSWLMSRAVRAPGQID